MRQQLKHFMLTVLVALCSITTFAHDFEVDGIYYNYNSDGTSVSVTYRGDYSWDNTDWYTGAVTIPSSVTYGGKTCSVTSIENSAFSRCSSLTIVTIPKSVTGIGSYAFEYCSGLTSVTIPNSVKSIGKCAFYGCSGLTSITIGNSVISIGESAFEDCSGVKSIIIPNSVTSIGDVAFAGCRGLTSITIPNSVTSIGRLAFYGSGITSVIIPNSMMSIGESAFSGCLRLISVIIPNSVTSIEADAFYNCISLTSIIIPNSVTSIGDVAFSDCRGLISITIPNSVTNIGNYAFSGCPLTDVKVSWNSLEGLNIVNNAFTDVYNITLWVPTGTTAAYEGQSPWNNFKEIREYVPGGNEGEEKCEAPTISYQNGELVFSSATAGAKYYYSVSCDDVTQLAESEDGHVKLAASYTITAYAFANGHDNSEAVTATLFFTSATIDAVETAMAEPAHGIVVMQQGSNIVLSGTEAGRTVNIYSTDGKLIGSTVSRDGITTIPCMLNSGAMYIVRYGETAVKCMAR